MCHRWISSHFCVKFVFVSPSLAISSRHSVNCFLLFFCAGAQEGKVDGKSLFVFLRAKHCTPWLLLFSGVGWWSWYEQWAWWSRSFSVQWTNPGHLEGVGPGNTQAAWQLDDSLWEEICTLHVVGTYFPCHNFFSMSFVRILRKCSVLRFIVFCLVMCWA